MKETMEEIEFKDVQAGMLLTDGIVVQTGQPGTSTFYKDEAYIYILAVEDGYYGQMSRSVTENEIFTILAYRGSDVYKDAIKTLIEERQNCMKEAKQDITFLRGL